jgi:hypothetical protein
VLEGVLDPAALQAVRVASGLVGREVGYVAAVSDGQVLGRAAQSVAIVLDRPGSATPSLAGQQKALKASSRPVRTAAGCSLSSVMMVPFLSAKSAWRRRSGRAEGACMGDWGLSGERLGNAGTRPLEDAGLACSELRRCYAPLALRRSTPPGLTLPARCATAGCAGNRDRLERAASWLEVSAREARWLAAPRSTGNRARCRAGA